MSDLLRYTARTIALTLCLVTVSGADDPETATTEAAATDAEVTANPQATDDGAKEESAASEAAAEDAADKPSENAPAEDKPAENKPDEDEPGENEPAEVDEPSPEDQAFLQDPFTFLQGDMQSATLDLKDGQTTPPADVTQPRILRRLGLLIEQLEQQGTGAGQAGQRVNRPAQQSSLMRGPGGQNEMRAARDDGRDWADLSPKERQKILQSRTDGFPAGYDDILADYFRRVARAEASSPTTPDESAPDAPAGADESTQPQSSPN
jgi:hypothetical protein